MVNGLILRFNNQILLLSYHTSRKTVRKRTGNLSSFPCVYNLVQPLVWSLGLPQTSEAPGSRPRYKVSTISYQYPPCGPLGCNMMWIGSTCWAYASWERAANARARLGSPRGLIRSTSLAVYEQNLRPATSLSTLRRVGVV